MWLRTEHVRKGRQKETGQAPEYDACKYEHLEKDLIGAGSFPPLKLSRVEYV